MMHLSLDTTIFTHYWYIWVLTPFLLPYILWPFLPSNFKAKAVIELDCDVEKAYETITKDPSRCPVGASMTKGLQVGIKDKNETPTEWKEVQVTGEIITVKRDLGVKPGKVARMTQTMEYSIANMSQRWEYLIEPAEGKERCRITLDSHTEVRKGKWNSPTSRLDMLLIGGGKKWMIEYLNLVAGESGARKKWIS